MGRENFFATSSTSQNKDKGASPWRGTRVHCKDRAQREGFYEIYTKAYITKTEELTGILIQSQWKRSTINMSRSPDSKDNIDEGRSSSSGDFPHMPSADFQCFVCGAIFATDEDRKQHLEKEAHGKLHSHTTKKEMKLAREQEEWDEKNRQEV